MELKDYSEVVKQISISTGLAENEIFDFTESPISEELLNVIKFYSETLHRNYHYGIEPSHIIFRPYLNKNAGARFLNNIGLISINLGTIKWLYESFRENTSINDGEIRFFKIIRRFIDTDLSELMYQASLHFTFYHELAHLIQKSDFVASNLEEEATAEEEFNELKHLLELDADEYSALCVSTHILQYAEKFFVLDKPITEGFLILIIIPIILYILSFGNVEEIYYSKNSHPHPTIRLTLVSLTICHYANQSLLATGKEFQVDHREILFRAVEISEEFEKKYLDSHTVETFKNLLKENIEGVLDYVDKFNNLRIGNKDLAVYKWNLNAKQ
ncbi:conserved protein of unknown function [Tenacibaculum sp. 190130A14a]|uniref:IrrE N-terminal-like domain-containing protein n=1 Tax=Tenacibaculum polynesiense TaxID=3137857 RepID=A0ABM9P8H0_9FLAO